MLKVGNKVKVIATKKELEKMCSIFNVPLSGATAVIVHINPADELPITIDAGNKLRGTWYVREKDIELIETKEETGMHDSGKRQEFNTGAVRDTAEGKSRPDLISPFAQLRCGEWMRKGAEKYSERNWEKGIPISRCIASLERHLQQYKTGLMDEDHLAAIAVNAQFIMHFEAMVEKGLMARETVCDMPEYERKNNGKNK
jgi:hypothetical protein